jgi:GDP-4-dehydro-6-deoxy-D-mannose reductase
MRVAVTGVNGFVGRHLTRELSENGHSVIGIGLGSVDEGVAPLLSEYISADLRDRWPAVDCDAVVHLAALSAVGPSFQDPQLYINSNSAPMTHLGEALLKASKRVRVIAVSTGAVYRGAGADPLDESAPTVPSSPYIVSKLVTEAQSAYYRHRGLDILVMRPFNHLGPGQSTGFLLPDLVSEVTHWMKTGKAVRVGNLDTRRDYTDVRDVARAYRLALEAPGTTQQVLNVCSGKGVSGREILQLIAETLGVERPDVVVDESKIRPGDPQEVRGDNTAIAQALGWQPSVPLSQSVRDMIYFGADRAQ